MQECERKIATMEKRVKELDALFMKPENAANMELVTEYTTLKQALDAENDKWLTLSERVEDIQKEQE